MLKFKDYICLDESKQRGVLYHFTRLDLFMKMIDVEFQKELGGNVMSLYTARDGVSLTRNYMLPTYPGTSLSGLSIKNGYTVRIALDGNRLSDKYSIIPVSGYSVDSITKDSVTDVNSKSPRMKRHNGEFEELVIHKNNFVDLMPYVIRVDIYNGAPEEVISVARQHGIEVHGCRSFVPIKL